MEIIDQKNLDKLKALNNEKVIKIVEEFIDLCKPSKVTVITDSVEDIEYCRQKSIELGEEAKLEIEGHTV
ncbi:MAG: phosphoenolpyruvate carboxykinase, partial [Candidatus Lokiarchaeota archaeon]|nr:phosphoenolpyruvate carboxykinase [Candidatus Lokiarchaeota archaeon]